MGPYVCRFQHRRGYGSFAPGLARPGEDEDTETKKAREARPPRAAASRGRRAPPRLRRWRWRDRDRRPSRAGDLLDIAAGQPSRQ
jgi:hypothetical protein